MELFKLVTDTSADLPLSFLKENNIGCMPLSYMLEGRTYNDLEGLSSKEFYSLVRAGKMPTTSQVNPLEAKTYFKSYLKESDQILYLAFSSALSGTYNSGCIAAQEILEEYPNCKINVIDTKCASLGQGLLVYYARQLQKEGRTMDEVTDWVNRNLEYLVHVFTVDDLNHLYRGGRVSKTTAIIGTVAGIKPIMHVDANGSLSLLEKVRGRKKSLSVLLDYYQKMRATSFSAEPIFIVHADALEEATALKDALKKSYPDEEHFFLIGDIGPTIGAHAGPGTVGLFFLGKKR